VRRVPTCPLHVLGVRRSGTTLLRVILDRSSELAIPDESYFVPQLARRHRGPVDVARFLDDVGRLATVRDWGLRADDIEPRLEDGMSPGAAIGAIFESYAAAQGKSRWGDKTPLYMQHLGVLEHLFPDALFVHLVRDGRDAALSFLAVPPGIMTEGWGHPRDAAGFACQWRTEVEAARGLGARVGRERYLELRYEEVVAAPEEALRAATRFAGIPYEPAMLEYVGQVDAARKPHQQRLNQQPTPGVRDWRTEMRAEDVEAFETIAGDLLSDLGYETRDGVAPNGSARRSLLRYRALTAAWRSMGAATQRSPLWRRRHPLLS
jgi:Sulfotransferase family